MMVVMVHYTTDKCSVLEIKPGDKNEKPMEGLLTKVALTGLGFLPYIGSQSQGPW